MKTAIIAGDVQISYRQLRQRIEAYSRLFAQKSYKTVGIYGKNSLDWIAAFYSAWNNGCIAVPIEYQASENEIAYMINDCKPDLLFICPEQEQKIEQVRQMLDYTPQVVCLGSVCVDESEDVEWKVSPKENEQTAVIIYTSGTTGSPKGVMLSFKNLITVVKGVSEAVHIFDPDRQVLMLLPLHHVLPLLGSMIAPLYVGSTVVLCPSIQSSDLLATLKNNQVAIIIGVPRLYEMLHKGIKAKIDASIVGRLMFVVARFLNSKAFSRKIFHKVHESFGGGLMYLVSGGASLPKKVGSFFQTLGLDVLDGYGMTEAAPLITFTHPGKIKIGSPGIPMPGLSVEIRNGEVVAKGDNIMQGYYNKPQQTRQVLRDGWLYTGDVGHFDKNGYLFLTGRKKEIIVLPNGKNINPLELEVKLEKGADVIKEAGVFLHNNSLHVIIYPDYSKLAVLGITDYERYFREQILTTFNQKQTSYKRIMQFTLINMELPRTRLAKIKRFLLPELVSAKLDTSNKSVSNDMVAMEEYLSVKRFIENEVKMEVKPDHHIEFDLSLDSLGKLSLIDYIEQNFGLLIHNEDLDKFPIISDLVAFIARSKDRFTRTDATHWSDSLKEGVDIALPKRHFNRTMIAPLSRLMFKLYFRFKGKGVGNIPDGPCIIAPNHQSFLDGLFVASLLKSKILKKTYFYAKRQHVNNVILRFLAKRNNIILMDMDDGLKESIQALAEALRRGFKVIVFPEGTRSIDGKLGEFKKMFAMLALKLNVPIVPVAISGAYEALPRGEKFPRIKTSVSVDFLSPVFPTGHAVETLSDIVREAIQSQINQFNQ